MRRRRSPSRVPGGGRALRRAVAPEAGGPAMSAARAWLLLIPLPCASLLAAADLPSNYVAGALIQLNDNGAWSWFMDERAIVHEGKLIVGSVRAVRDFHGGEADPNWGNVELAVYDMERGEAQRVVLDPHFEQDDHDNPAFLSLPD